MSISNALSGVRDDLRSSVRALSKERAYLAAAALTLALGIGATTAVFAVIDATLVRPLPYSDPSSLVALNAVGVDPDGAQSSYPLSQIELVRWRAAAQAFDAIDAIEPRTLALTGTGDPEVVNAGAVTSGLVPMLGVSPRFGRTFTAAEEASETRVAVISEGLWQRRFGSDPAVLHQTITLNGQVFEIVGVMPGGFRPLLVESDVWVPLHPIADASRQGLRVMASAGRLRPGVTAQQAQSALGGISADLAREFPTSHGRMRPSVVDLRESLFGTRRPALLALGGGVGLLLVLACVNVLNLTLGHLAGRRAELATRAVLGAGTWRLARLQAVHSLLIAVIGGSVGFAIMSWGLPILMRLYGGDGRPLPELRVDWRVGTLGALVTIGTALVSGIVPAVRTAQASFEGPLARLASARVGGGRWERRVRSALVVAQVALAITLLSGAVVFAASLERRLTTTPGFTPSGVLSMQLTLAPARYPDIPARSSFVEQMLARVSALPGVVAAGTTQTTFLPGQSMQTLLYIDGRPVDAEHTETSHIRHITPGYFKALGVPIVEGRAFDDRDQIGTLPVCLVSARFAKQYWPGQSAVGHRIRRLSATAPWMTIVGVAADVMDAGLGVAQGPTLYVDYLQLNTATARVSLVVRTAGDPLSLSQAVQRAIWSVDPGQPVSRVARLGDLLVESTGDERFRALLLSAFALIGLALAVVGIYGVTVAAVRSRTWETGVRMALGASPARVVRDLMNESVRRLLGGVVIGLAVFLALGRLSASLLYNTRVFEPGLLACAVAPLVVLAGAVTYWQARRLGAVAPIAAIRNEP